MLVHYAVIQNTTDPVYNVVTVLSPKYLSTLKWIWYQLYTRVVILSTVGDSYRNQNDALSTFAVIVNVVNRGCVFSVKQDKMECDDETASIFALRHYWTTQENGLYITCSESGRSACRPCLQTSISRHSYISNLSIKGQHNTWLDCTDA